MSYLALEDSFFYKIIIFGEANSGKTAFTDAIAEKPFREKIPKTIGVNLIKKQVFHRNVPITIYFWDFSGETKFQTIFQMYSRGTSAGLFIFDLNDLKSLYQFKYWVKLINNSPFPIIIVGNKCDLVNAISRKNIKNLIPEITGDYNVIDYIECSCKYNIGIEEVMNSLSEKLFCL